MVTYVVATRREAQASPSTAEDYVREVPGVWIRGGTDPNRITIEASELAAAEIERRFGSVLPIEPEITPDDPGVGRQRTLAEEIMHEDQDILRALSKL
jgi:hypothetical protein